MLDVAVAECRASVSQSIVLIGVGKQQQLERNRPSHLPSVLYLQTTGEQLVRFCGSRLCAISHVHFFQNYPQAWALESHSSKVAV